MVIYLLSNWTRNITMADVWPPTLQSSCLPRSYWTRRGVSNIVFRDHPSSTDLWASCETKSSDLAKRSEKMWRFGPLLQTSKNQRHAVTKTKQLLAEAPVGSEKMFDWPYQCPSFSVENIGFKSPWLWPNNTPIFGVHDLFGDFIKTLINNEGGIVMVNVIRQDFFHLDWTKHACGLELHPQIWIATFRTENLILKQCDRPVSCNTPRHPRERSQRLTHRWPIHCWFSCETRAKAHLSS